MTIPLLRLGHYPFKIRMISSSLVRPSLTQPFQPIERYFHLSGAGLYSFFVNYDQSRCIPERNCQAQIADIDTRSTVYLTSLSTVASVWQLSVNRRGVVNQA